MLRHTLVVEVVELLLTLEVQVELAVEVLEEMIPQRQELLEPQILVVVEVAQEEMPILYYQEQVVQES